MFKTISWQEFLITASLVTGAYYVINGLLLYHREIISKFTKRNQSTKKAEPKQVQPESNTTDDLIGEVRHEEHLKKFVPHENLVKAEEINVQPLDEEGVNTSQESAGPQDTSDDDLISGLQNEIKTLIQILSDNKANKSEGIQMIQSLLARYPHLVNTSHQEVIDQFVVNACKEHNLFEVEQAEVKTWWPTGEIN